MNSFFVSKCCGCGEALFIIGDVPGLCKTCSDVERATWRTRQTPRRLRVAGWIRGLAERIQRLADRIDGGDDPAWRKYV